MSRLTNLTIFDIGALWVHQFSCLDLWHLMFANLGMCFDSFDTTFGKSCTKKLPDCKGLFVQSNSSACSQRRNMPEQHEITIWIRLKWVIASDFSFDHFAHVSPQTWGNHRSSHRSYHYGKGQHTVALFSWKFLLLKMTVILHQWSCFILLLFSRNSKQHQSNKIDYITCSGEQN